MKNSIKLIALMLILGLGGTSCSVTLPVTATSNPVGSKVGRASANGYFSLIFLGGDASIQKAARNGGITRISTVDIKQTNTLNILTGYETIVTGE